MSELGLISDRQRAAFWSRVDRAGECWLWLGALSGSGYGRLNARGVTVYAHRLALVLTGVEVPADRDVDHTCHERRCVRPEHLRVATRSQNNQNKAAQTNSLSGIRGVSWHKATGKWRVSVGHRRHQIFGGLFDDIADAERAAVALRNQLFTHNDNDRRRTA